MLDINQLKSLRKSALDDMKNLICSNELYRKLEDIITICVSGGWNDITVIFKLIPDEQMFTENFENTEVGKELSKLINIIQRDNTITIYLSDSLFKPLFNSNSNVDTDELVTNELFDIIDQYINWFKGYGIAVEHLGFNPAYIIKIED